ncbi:HK97 gp10 family phage protein [Brevibacillus dissolubilis]|uniref:HK97 gp10 family phage protein n=1 Tax=Brevibacillus dissolubilis TaxID=1844116 RepID=UPI0011168BE4|nr:HK97 gp10 family phage protein [Brevibacillus dissolubilis]
MSSSDIAAFARKLEKLAGGELKRELAQSLERAGLEFLDLVQKEIVRSGTINTKTLLQSFEKGNADNVWQLTHGGMTLEVGTNVEYASLANDGHWQERRFVPGEFRGGRFIYSPNASTGMLLKAKWVKGTNYWDAAIAVMDRQFEQMLDRLLQRYLDQL